MPLCTEEEWPALVREKVTLACSDLGRSVHPKVDEVTQLTYPWVGYGREVVRACGDDGALFARAVDRIRTDVVEVMGNAILSSKAVPGVH